MLIVDPLFCHLMLTRIEMTAPPPFSRVSVTLGLGSGSLLALEWCEGPRLLPAPATKAVRAKRSAERRPGPGGGGPSSWGGRETKTAGLARRARAISECGLRRQEHSHSTVRITLSTHSHWSQRHWDIRQHTRWRILGTLKLPRLWWRLGDQWPSSVASRDQAKPSGD